MIGEISQRFYRVFFVLMCVASGIGLLTLIYFNFWFNRLAAVTFLVDFSTFLLVGFLLLLVIRYTLLIVFAFLQHLERSHEPWHPPSIRSSPSSSPPTTRASSSRRRSSR
jgi:uncharacterized membrane protein YdfJ with MMPL/SSD domain